MLTHYTWVTYNVTNCCMWYYYSSIFYLQCIYVYHLVSNTPHTYLGIYEHSLVTLYYYSFVSSIYYLLLFTCSTTSLIAVDCYVYWCLLTTGEVTLWRNLGSNYSLPMVPPRYLSCKILLDYYGITSATIATFIATIIYLVLH